MLSLTHFYGWKNECSNMKNVVTVLHNINASTVLENQDVCFRKLLIHQVSQRQEINCETSENAKTLYNTHIYRTVSDNASNMVKMSKGHKLWHSACNSHTANLLAKDLLPTNVSPKVNQVLKTFIQTSRSAAPTRVCLAGTPPGALAVTPPGTLAVTTR
ncbi:hypothetical protein PR048_000095 [Dryococelus australis]|uniref:Uncharacterized protein n=1 Tax=Dryococelus australis TaxID=614101 RepID=A0ABQ9IFW3_9NEOP|nr:hypothetical protein PR048_000095 [Dryococelus australis]